MKTGVVMIGALEKRARRAWVWFFGLLAIPYFVLAVVEITGAGLDVLGGYLLAAAGFLFVFLAFWNSAKSSSS